MTSRTIDEILNKLSIKFNRIFYDREFVCCVCEDLQTIIKNKNTCCVLVFPILSPSYLKVVRYQAKLLDLAVISLGNGSTKSVGVCHKKFVLSNSESDKKSPKINLGSEEMAESSNTSRKKRPPIQLYVPPAQRRSRLSETHTQKEITKNETSQKNVKLDREMSIDLGKSDETKKKIMLTQSNSPEQEVKNDDNSLCFCSDDVGFLNNFNFPYFSYQCNSLKFILFKDLFPFAKLLIFNIERIKHSFHWFKWLLDNKILIKDDKYIEKWLSSYIQRHLFQDSKKNNRNSIIVSNDLCKIWENTSENTVDYQNIYYLIEDNITWDLPLVSIPQNEIFNSDIVNDYLHCYLTIDGSLDIKDFIKFYTNSITLPKLVQNEKISLESLLDISRTTESPQMPFENGKTTCDSESKHTSTCAKVEGIAKEVSKVNSEFPENPNDSKQVDKVIVLDNRIEPPKISPIIQDKMNTKKCEHEQEKEIMRKAKQKINRKTRPIIKYVDDDDTLKIGKNDNINNWEDLFNDNGELQDEIFTEIIHKVGSDVTIVKAEEDYSAYTAKQIEELEHMVELYDFPPTLETRDIISAFSELNSDSMYVKWVDDTHAILVLGSHTQALKAVEMSNTLIKVRPMSAASSSALEKANQFDLKPAMKRPQTNLQTARRLITSHLGAKSRISKEQSAKEREDLRVAKEQKKQAKQNEKDAWEGSLRSVIN